METEPPIWPLDDIVVLEVWLLEEGASFEPPAKASNDEKSSMANTTTILFIYALL